MFGIAAATLAAIGLYGVLANFVTQRQLELGIRGALGATPGDLRRLVLARSARLTLAGLVLGLVFSAGFAQILHAALFGLDAWDGRAWGATCAAVAAIALLATIVPSRSASRVDVSRALHSS
jgi:ABC-type antimicrobial peptide transport system permease subunit